MCQDVVRVLNVDDEPSATDLCKELLESEHDRFTVKSAHSAEEGLRTLGDCEIDCIVSDYNMPNRDGLEFLQAVREEYDDLPFILFTGKGSEAIASEAISAGVTDYLQKRGGRERYELLANRIENAVSQYRSAQQLHETRTEYAAVFENARNGLILVDVEDDGFRFRRCNPRASELSGLDREEFVGKTPRETLSPESRNKVVGAYRKCVDRREPVEYTVTLDHPIGRVVHESIVTPVITDGDVDQLVVAFTDITQRRETRQKLQIERAFVEQAFAMLEKPCYVLNSDGAIVRWNDRTLDVTGYSASELDGMPAVELFPGDQRGRITDAVETSKRDGRATVETDLLTADDRRIPHTLTATCVTDEDGDIAGLVVVGEEIAES